ncbi:hypothetical protein BDP27DRAFT_1414859 [Rhodocollybia butyracea]|uniref:Uncharacterized protein n=1 Tax=Rhodocollybia butyracea TaxID=206335 RepID=A0A9P5PZU6_9AGAR|nr:hypothetical protein BDP27DRAFT_1414859 [Rhodocollybia butyracea]
MSQAESQPPSTFLLLAQEIRDQIYDYLLFMRSASPPYAITPITEDWILYDWHWQVPPSHGSCFGVLCSCRQVYIEILSSLERHGLNYEIKLSVVNMPLPNTEEWPYLTRFRDAIWSTWVVLPLCRYPKLHTQDSHLSGNMSLPAVNSQCHNLHVWLDVQADSNYEWLGNGGLAELPQNLLTMLAKFLLQGPVGLSKPQDASIDMWNIDTLHIDIISTGSTFHDPHNGNLLTVPQNGNFLTVPSEHTEFGLAMHLERLSTSGALSGRVRVVRLAREGVIQREWFIKQGESLHPSLKQDWADNGWVIENEDLPTQRLMLSAAGQSPPREAASQRHRPLRFCCVVQ